MNRLNPDEEVFRRRLNDRTFSVSQGPVPLGAAHAACFVFAHRTMEQMADFVRAHVGARRLLLNVAGNWLPERSRLKVCLSTTKSASSQSRSEQREQCVK